MLVRSTKKPDLKVSTSILLYWDKQAKHFWTCLEMWAILKLYLPTYFRTLERFSAMVKKCRLIEMSSFQESD